MSTNQTIQYNAYPYSIKQYSWFCTTFWNGRILYLRSKLVNNYFLSEMSHSNCDSWATFTWESTLIRIRLYYIDTVDATPFCRLFHLQQHMKAVSGTLTVLESKYPGKETPSINGWGNQLTNVPESQLTAGWFWDEFLSESSMGCAHSSYPHINASIIVFSLLPLLPNMTSQIN